MEVLIDPNVAYVLIVLAALLALITILVPGTGLPEAGLILCLVAAWYAASQLKTNPWALLAVVISLGTFLGAVRSKPRRLALLALTFLLLTTGSLFLFVDENGWPAVNPVLAGSISVLSGFFMWFVVQRVLASQHSQPLNDPNAMVGRLGEARTNIHNEGSAQVLGELWSARSETPILAGSSVRVVAREGFVVIVEKVTK